MATEKELICYVCSKEYLGKEPETCCSGHMCGCMGMPTNPAEIVCSDECYDKLMSKKNSNINETYGENDFLDLYGYNGETK